MFKNKILHRRSKKNKSRLWNSKYYNEKNIDIFSDLPKHEAIGKKFPSWYYNFDTTPLYEFIFSKVDENWNDVYSEIIKKIKPKYRYDIEYHVIDEIKNDVIYDENFIPRNSSGEILSNRLFVDMNNILCLKTEEELLLDSKKYLRTKKLKEILISKKLFDEDIF